MGLVHGRQRDGRERGVELATCRPRPPSNKPNQRLARQPGTRRRACVTRLDGPESHLPALRPGEAFLEENFQEEEGAGVATQKLAGHLLGTHGCEKDFLTTLFYALQPVWRSVEVESTYLCIWALHGYLAARMKTGWPKSIIPSTHIDGMVPL